MIMDLQPGDLDRIFERHILQKLEPDSVRGVLEAAVALTVAGEVGRTVFANRQRRGPPEFSTIFVAKIEDFAWPIADRIVGPWADLILLAVDRPRVTSAFDGDLEAEGGVGDDVDPRRGRPLSFAGDRYIFAAVTREAPQAIEKFQLRRWRSDCRNFNFRTARSEEHTA